MFAIFQEEKIITICMLVFMGVSLFLRIILGGLYRNMIREADNMATTENKLLKQCKLKFAHCYQLNNGVANIPIFVDKFLNRLALGPLSFETMYHLSGQLMLLAVVSSGIGVCKSIIGGRMLGEILPFYIVSFLGLYLYFSVATVVDIKGKKRVLKVNLVDYLENHLSCRIDVTESDMEMLFGEGSFHKIKRLGQGNGKRTVELRSVGGQISMGRIPFEESITVEEKDIRPIRLRREETPRQETTGFTRAQEEELEELLKEFLGGSSCGA